MPSLLIRHKVNDYDKWKKVFDAFKVKRKANGEKSFRVFHPYDDQNDLFILFEWDDLSRAKDFINSEELKEKMDLAGVIDQPDIYFLTKVYEGVL